MKKLFLAFVAIAIVSSSVQAKYSGGSGTAGDPYRIGDACDLLTLAANTGDYDANFILIADINLDPNLPGNQVFTSAVIAPDTNNFIDGFQGTAFTGAFDGNGHKITNLTISTVGNYIGLFGYLENGEIKNLGVENFSIPTTDGLGDSGGLVGLNAGNIDKCYSTGIIDANHSAGIGGLVGSNSGSITDSNSSIIISTGNNSDNIGGLVGGNDGIINHCFASGDLSGYNYENIRYYVENLGGLVGNNAGTITDSSATGNISGVGYYVGFIGGLVGSNNEGTISNCYAAGTVTGIGSDYCHVISLGGLVGENGNDALTYTGIIINCYSTGNVGGDYSNTVGGLVGGNCNLGVISNSYSTGSITGALEVGGLAGENDGTITNCYSTGAVTGSDTFGGFAGYNYYGTITACFWDINTSGTTVSDGEGATGETTAEMKKEKTFTDAGWDFVGETTNGTEDIWRMCVDDVNYPLLWWQFNKADFTCPDGVNFADFAKLAEWWNHTDCADNNNCDNTDLDLSGAVDIYDLKLFCDNWLE